MKLRRTNKHNVLNTQYCSRFNKLLVKQFNGSLAVAFNVEKSLKYCFCTQTYPTYQIGSASRAGSWKFLFYIHSVMIKFTLSLAADFYMIFRYVFFGVTSELPSWHRAYCCIDFVPALFFIFVYNFSLWNILHQNYSQISVYWKIVDDIFFVSCTSSKCWYNSWTEASSGSRILGLKPCPIELSAVAQCNSPIHTVNCATTLNNC